jgi:heme exporter protein A
MTPLLSTVELAQVRGDRLLFAGLSLSLAAGEALWIEGHNGSGKTSLLRLLCGLAEPWRGEVRWQGRPLPTQRAAFQAELLYAGHRPGLKDGLTVLENLLGAASLAGRPCTESQGQAALQGLGLQALAHQPVQRLSEGQRRRAGLARLLLPNAPLLWVLDEPFAALDAASVARVAGAIDAHGRAGGVVVFTSHQGVPLHAGTRHLVLHGQAARWTWH